MSPGALPVTGASPVVRPVPVVAMSAVGANLTGMFGLCVRGMKIWHGRIASKGSRTLCELHIDGNVMVWYALYLSCPCYSSLLGTKRTLVHS